MDKKALTPYDDRGYNVRTRSSQVFISQCRSAEGAQYAEAPKARNMIARGKREARRPW
jgi:hypothetical protein